MLEIGKIRQNPAAIKAGLLTRNFTPEASMIVDRILELDEKRRELQLEIEGIRSDINKRSAEIGGLFKQGKKDEAEVARNKVAAIKEQLGALETESSTVETNLEELLYELPNMPHESVLQGKGEDDNEVFQAWKQNLPTLDGEALPHWELAAKYGIFDLEAGVKLTGAGFPVFRGKGARLQRGLINFFLDRARDAGYEEVQPPHMVNEATARATGQLPDKEGQMYFVEKDNLYLIPTAEVPLTNLFRDQIVDAADFPIKVTGYTPCFRREAGSYGAHVRGLNRVHQFDKVEVVQIAHPDRSYEVLKEMVAYIEGILQDLELPYRILRLCSGDLGFTAALTFDFEVYSAAQERWLEVSSVSNFETFQSNRLKLRFKEDKKTRLVHTLNGSALALPRIIAALLENNQTADGIRIPSVLRSYTGFAGID